MARTLFIILVLILPLTAFGQNVVKVNIVELAGKIPPPPADVTEAYARSACQEDPMANGAVSCTAEAFYKPSTDRLNATGKEIEKALMALSQPAMNAAKDMDSKEMRKKMKSMSQEEKMKMAMEMSKKMGMGGPIARESDAVMAATQECNTVSGEIGKDMQKAQEFYQRKEKLSQDRQSKHKEIEIWIEAEEVKLPQINTGEMSVAEPKALHALLLKAMAKHLIVENEYLKGIQKEWKISWDKYKARYGTLQARQREAKVVATTSWCATSAASACPVTSGMVRRFYFLPSGGNTSKLYNEYPQVVPRTRPFRRT